MKQQKVKNIEPPKNVNINDEELTIEWSDGHKTSFKTEWLSKIANENPSKSPYEPLLHPTFWNTSYFNSLPLPYVHYDEVSILHFSSFHFFYLKNYSNLDFNFKKKDNGREWKERRIKEVVKTHR